MTFWDGHNCLNKLEPNFRKKNQDLGKYNKLGKSNSLGESNGLSLQIFPDAFILPLLSPRIIPLRRLCHSVEKQSV